MRHQFRGGYQSPKPQQQPCPPSGTHSGYRGKCTSSRISSSLQQRPQTAQASTQVKKRVTVAHPPSADDEHRLPTGLSATTANLARKRRQRSQDFKRFTAYDISEEELLSRSHRHQQAGQNASPSDPHFVDWPRFAADLCSGIMQCCRRTWYMDQMARSPAMI